MKATLDWARQTSVTIYHPTGTCKMGNDKMAVVDERLRVYGSSKALAWPIAQSCQT